MKKTQKSAFTLIELLVVIGIIGVLSAVMVGVMRGSSDSARAAQCMNNMRGLAVAAMNHVMASDYGNYPTAGSYKYRYMSTKKTYPEVHGWVSWGKCAGSSSPAGGDTISFSEANYETRIYAITNGCLWSAGSKSEKTYLCPEHDAACLKANKTHPGWSYVMNESFGWARNGTGTPLPGWTGLSSGSTLSVYDKDLNANKARAPQYVLMFAEIQGYTDAEHGLTALTSASGESGDGVLQYRNTSESIGFNHLQNSGKLSGHVAFADGHVEKFLYPESGGAEQLTRWLCAGRQVAFTGTAYQDLTGNN